MRIEGVVLENEANSALFRLKIGNVFIPEPNLAIGRLQKAGNHVKGGGFAATGRAKEANELAIGNRDVQLVDRMGVGNAFLGVSRENLCQVFNANFHLDQAPLCRIPYDYRWFLPRPQ